MPNIVFFLKLSYSPFMQLGRTNTKSVAIFQTYHSKNIELIDIK